MFNDLFWAIYWIDVLSSLPKQVFGGGLVISILILGVAALGSLAIGERSGTTSEQDRRDAQVFRKKVIISGFIFWLITIGSSLIPEKSTMYMMLGVKTTENVVESPLGKKLQAIVDAEVDGYLAKLKPKKN